MAVLYPAGLILWVLNEWIQWKCDVFSSRDYLIFTLSVKAEACEIKRSHMLREKTAGQVIAPDMLGQM